MNYDRYLVTLFLLGPTKFYIISDLRSSLSRLRSDLNQLNFLKKIKSNQI